MGRGCSGSDGPRTQIACLSFPSTCRTQHADSLWIDWTEESGKLQKCHGQESDDRFWWSSIHRILYAHCKISGWWFQTWMDYFPFHIWHIWDNPPTMDFIFLKMVLAPPTRSVWIPMSFFHKPSLVTRRTQLERPGWHPCHSWAATEEYGLPGRKPKKMSCLNSVKPTDFATLLLKLLARNGNVYQSIFSI